MTRARPFCIHAAARDAGTRGGIVFDGTLVTWSDLSRDAEICERALVERGDMHSPVALRASSRPETIAALLGFVASGAPLALVHPRATAIEAERLARAAGARGSLIDDELVRHALEDRRFVAPVRGGDRQATLVLFTSGSTGREKAVVIEEPAFDASARSSEAIFGWRADDRWLLTMPLSHVGGLSVLLRCLRARRTVVVHPRFDPDEVLASIRANSVTIASFVPTMLHALLERDSGNVLARLRAVLVGGARASLSLLEECAARKLAVHTTYGLTEAASQVTTQRRPATALDADAGRAVAGVTVTIHGPDGAPVGAGREGRIRVGGPVLMRGYVDASPIDDVFDTDDLGVLDDGGRLFVLGRRSDRIVTGGENVDPLEVESVLEGCPGVARAVVFGIADERWGELVAAAVEWRGDPDVVEAALQARTNTMLASYKRPRRIAFAETLPCVKNGTKLDRARCRAELTPLLRPFR